jgi:hypothetical protein
VELARSLVAGRIGFDLTEADACLGALANASCDDVAALVTALGDAGLRRWPPKFEACGRVLVGQVARDGACLVSEDCRTPIETPCSFGDDMCSGRCRGTTMLVALGGACEMPNTYCKDGNVCRATPLPEGAATCVAPAGDGGTCVNDEHCAFGFFCQRETQTAAESTAVGRCRALGAACAGSWACPRVLACVAGRCQPGKAPGDVCVVQGTDQTGGPISDCAHGLRCLDVDGRGLRCFAGAKVGQPCGAATAGRPAIGCDGGWCDGAAGVCRGPRGPNETCSLEMTCAPPGECRVPDGSPAICIEPPDEQPLGNACLGDDARECPVGAYCRLTPLGGSCERYRRPGEPCQGEWNNCALPDGCLDRCEPLTKCVGGVCKAC